MQEEQELQFEPEMENQNYSNTSWNDDWCIQNGYMVESRSLINVSAMTKGDIRGSTNSEGRRLFR